MSTTETLGFAPSRPAEHRVGSGVGRLLHAFATRRRQKRDLVRLARVEPRLLRDMGFDPAVVREAVRGTWDEIDPGRYHSDAS